LVDDLPERFGKLPSGGWPESPQQALLLPIEIPGQKRVLGVLVAAVSPHLGPDESYRGFLGLVAAGIAALGALEAGQRRVDFRLQEDEVTVNARLAAIVDCCDDAIVGKTLNGMITSWNDGARRIFGYTEAEAVGQHITLIVPEELHAEEGEVL